MEPQRKQEIDQLLKDYQGRGEMTRQQFCESRGMTPSALDYYVRRYQKPAAVTRLAKVTVKAASTQTPGGFRLVLSNGRRIECAEADLAQLIRAAETA